ncbi:ferrous iron transport protein B [Deferribacter autotrophicus]|uniref:Ferrous iron transport protein B n=1 Tax=Deferribacter autotrophicus TaxID=500465 RepID=A0A5A8F2V3_9BACT|nr:ferrous iron transport protein B [Deferribacter autotrophicus]KAA0257794.1 ferrous iron transport protein B [Deferribacter autotrophicus]
MHKKEYKVLLVGNPNVGKSALFYNITKKYASVSNYPGTTVSIFKGKTKIGTHHEIEIIDTPGFYNFLTITEEEKVTKEIIFKKEYDCILHVVDAKNIVRMLPLTFQLMEAGIPTILVLNMYDELECKGMEINISHLEHDLGIPVVKTTAIKNKGTENLISRLVSILEGRYNFQPVNINYGNNIEVYIKKITSLLKNEYPISKRAIALLLLQKDKDTIELIKSENNYPEIIKIINSLPEDLNIEISSKRLSFSQELCSEHFYSNGKSKGFTIKQFLDKITLHPVAGFIAVLLILYFGFYKFVGQFGAGTLVDFIETKIFEESINPYINNLFHKLLGSTIFFNLFAGDYGIITLGLRYAIAIVLPVVSTFFFMFSLLEDSGYLVRLSIILDKSLKKIGLSGRSVIPLILGLGCGTMATVVTRTLETKRERLLVTFLLALTIPCSAQLGVILGLFEQSFSALLIWFFTILIVFLLSGFILNRYTKGKGASFFMEVPPLRMPSLKNVFLKTYSRLKWYALEVIPLFIFASILIWIGKITKLFDLFSLILSYPAKLAGLPEKMGEIFLYGFFRRDFGAAGLYDIQNILSIRHLLVASVILTLFVPCIAQLSVMIKERGFKTSMIIFGTVIPFAFFVGIILNAILVMVGY